LEAKRKLFLAVSSDEKGRLQGCQTVYFQTKNTILVKFWRAFDGKMLIYFMPVWNILRTFGIFYDHLLHLVFVWQIISGFGIMYS
jgi:hypothetical protein